MSEMVLPENMGHLVEAPWSVQKAILMGIYETIGVPQWYEYLNDRVHVCRLPR